MMQKIRPHFTYPILAAVALIAAGVLVALALRGNEMDPTNTSNAHISANTVNAITNVSEPLEAGSILFLGDMMMGRYVETLRHQKGEDYVFEKTNALRSDYDAIVANLEGPIVRDHTQTPDNSLVFSFEPVVASVLQAHGITAVSLANNHTLNAGQNGLYETRQYLDAAGVQYFGDPSLMQSSDTKSIMLGDQEVILVGFLAINATFNAQAASEMIQAMHAEHPDAILIVYPHWGEEYAVTSSARQQTLAHTFIDAGAEAVIGSHPHVVQEIEVYHNKLIAYSLGNFIFDQYFSEDTKQSLALGMKIQNDRIEYSLVPLQSENSQPSPMSVNDAAAFLERLSVRSSDDLLEAIRSATILLPL